MLCIARGWWQQARLTREITKETVKTIARGMPGVSGVTVVTTLVCFFISHTRLRAQRAPGVPCALVGREIFAQLGRIAPRDRGGVSEIGVAV
jgi:hypothetical protein